jgi:hypothetical protein
LLGCLVDQEAVLVMAAPVTPAATALLGKETTGGDLALTPIMVPGVVAELALLALPQQLVLVGVLEKFLISTELQHTMREAVEAVEVPVVDLAVVVLELRDLQELMVLQILAAAEVVVLAFMLAMPLQAQAVPEL